MLLPLAFTLAYLLLLSGAVIGSRNNALRRWLALYLFGVALLALLQGAVGPTPNFGLPAALPTLLPPPAPRQSALAAILALHLLNVGLLGLLTAQYQRVKYSHAWPIAGGLTGLTVLGLALWEPASALGGRTWLEAMIAPLPSYASLLAALFYVLLGFGQELLTLLALRMETVPLRANRNLFWGLVLPVLVSGELLAAWGGGVGALAGQVLRLAGVAGVTYAVTTARLVDVRGLLRRWVGDLVFLALVSFLILLGIGLGRVILDLIPSTRGLLALGLLALLLGVLYQALRGFAAQAVRQIILNIGYDSAAAARRFSEQIATSLDVTEIVDAAALLFRQTLDTRRSLLMLLDPPRQGRVAARLFWPTERGNSAARSATFAADSPVLLTLKRRHHALLQYDIDEDPLYRAMQQDERRRLKALRMDVFMPIRDGEELQGIYALGPRESGDPYRALELELIALVADQSSVALKNARLFGDMRQLNAEMARLNESLTETNQSLAAMDRVKTDFITIASHELRTPLTQMRGYADVLGAMINQGALSPDVVKTIVESIKRASDRLDTVYGQMLDVSQIDVNAMDLKLVDTTLEAVLRLAVEPYTEAMRERRQTLTAQGLKNLPPIRGDFQRLVQAFGHILSNAIKFTPDGGRIDITAHALPGEDGQSGSVEVIVADHGVGIDPKYHELIFKKFFRIGSTALHSTGTTKFMGAGPGLGLPIAKGVIEGHGGRIWVESAGHDPDRLPGTRVHVTLPLSPPALDTRPAGARPDVEPVGSIQPFS